jgi:hypothetical protein
MNLICCNAAWNLIFKYSIISKYSGLIRIVDHVSFWAADDAIDREHGE